MKAGGINRYKTMKSQYYIVFLLILLILSVQANAQFDKDVLIIKTYNPTISDAFKLNVMPKIKDTLNFKPDFEYQVAPTKFPTGFEIEPIRPAKIVGEPLTRLYGNYVKLGFGSDISPLAEIRINSLRSKKSSYGIEARHHSSYGGFKIDDHKYYPNFNDNHLGVYGTKFMKDKSWSGKMDYTGSKIKYYGFMPDSAEVDKKDLTEQAYNLLTASTRLKSDRISKRKIHYDFDLGFYYFADTHESNENSFNLKADFRDHVKNSLVGFDTKFSYFDRNSIVDSLQNFIVELKPWVQRSMDEWKATLGVNMFSVIDPDENSETFFYPNIQFEFALADKFLLTYFGFTGELKNNYFRDVATGNPFVWAGFKTKHTQHRKIIFAGFKAHMSSHLVFDLKATYREIKENLLFADTLLAEGIEFVALYDNMDMVNINAEVKFDINEKIEGHVKGNYYSYFTLENEQQPWHKPDFDATVYATYNMQEKFLISAEVFVLGKRYARGDLLTTGKYAELQLDPVVDANLGIEYRYTKKISGFLKLNNLAAAKNYTWNYYPTQRFHALVGVTYAF